MRRCLKVTCALLTRTREKGTAMAEEHEKCPDCGTPLMDLERRLEKADASHRHHAVDCVVVLKERVKTLEGDLHGAIVCEREAEAKAASADVIVLPVTDGFPGEIDVCDPHDGHSHRYVPTSALEWEDVDDEWTAAIKAAHPVRSESHLEYAVAMKMVGHRHSKGELVALVNWLLVERARLQHEKRAK